MKVLITICGRAGSKGLKNKNIREFLGYPLVYYTIAAAYDFKEQSKFDVDIAVNSDSEELLQLAKKQDYINIVKRPAELGEDTTPKVSVIKDTLDKMEKIKNTTYDLIIDLDITSPIRKFKDIEGAVNKVLDNISLDLSFSAVHARRNPYFNMVEVIDGVATKVKHSNFVTRQQAPKVYDMNASIYCYKREALVNTIKVSPFDGKCGIVEMKDFGVLDIDNETDFKLMELICSELFKNEYVDLYNVVRGML